MHEKTRPKFFDQKKKLDQNFDQKNTRPKKNGKNEDQKSHKPSEEEDDDDGEQRLRLR